MRGPTDADADHFLTRKSLSTQQCSTTSPGYSHLSSHYNGNDDNIVIMINDNLHDIVYDDDNDYVFDYVDNVAGA